MLLTVLGFCFVILSIGMIIGFLKKKAVYAKNSAWIIILHFAVVFWMLIEHVMDGKGFTLYIIGLIIYLISGLFIFVVERKGMKLVKDNTKK